MCSGRAKSSSPAPFAIDLASSTYGSLATESKVILKFSLLEFAPLAIVPASAQKVRHTTLIPRFYWHFEENVLQL
jgi:hypothetical protein